MKQVKIIIVFLSLSYIVSAQIDREFWFAMPDIIEGNYVDFVPDNGEPITLNITALYETTVRISRPADPSFETYQVDLDEMEHIQLDLVGFFGLSLNKIETEATDAIFNNGFLIETWPGEITAIIEWGNNYNREIMSLKGKNALGREFFVSTQNKFKNYLPSGTGVPGRNGFTIVATQDNTTVRIIQEHDFGHHSVSGSPPDTIIKVLNRGQSYAIRATNEPSPHVTGVEVLSDKDIAVAYYDDALVFDGCGNDLMADQIVPVELTGKEYFVHKGNLDSLEFVFITATENNTNVQINGTNHFLANKGDTLTYDFTGDSAYISSSQGIYVNQVTGLGCELAGALVPSMDECVGSHLVPLSRSFNTLETYSFRLVARNDNNVSSPYHNQVSHYFYIINGSDTTHIPSGYFQYSSDSAFIYLDNNSAIQNLVTNTISPGDQIKVYNPVGRFHVSAILAQSSTVLGTGSIGAKYAYYSDYLASEPSAGIGGFTAAADTMTCNLDPIRFVASGGAEYVWTCSSNPAAISYLSNDSVAAPFFSPDTAGTYIFNVSISGSCGSKNIQVISKNYPTPAADFALSAYEGCSPDTVYIENISNTSYTAKSLWTFEPSGDVIDQDTMTNPFPYVLPGNYSDSLQTYTIRLSSYSPNDYCSSSREKEFVLKPQVDASFMASDSIGCAPLYVEFEETSFSGHDSLRYRWDFDNGSQSIDTIPDVTFTNIGSSTKTFDVGLVVETPYGCTDTASKQITVYPVVEAAFGVDTNFSCSPLIATFNPAASVNADSLFWHIADSVSIKVDLDPVVIEHYDSTVAGPDTIGVYLVAKNNQGCVDTSSNPQLVVYPRIFADFEIDKSVMCDADSVTIINKSECYSPRYEWDFGNNSYAQDTVDTSGYKKYYFNRSSSDTAYTITLKAISGNTCSEVVDTTITVHPYIKADFGFEYDDNCSPLTATISNTSIEVDTYEWDLGDGSPISNFNGNAFDHEYSNVFPDRDTTYIITLMATSSEGCTDSFSRSLQLLPEVVASFETDTNKICSHNEVFFNNNSTGSNLSFLWSFGDNQSSTAGDVSIEKYYENNFENDTNYTVRLIAKNDKGCSDTIVDSVLVYAKIQSFFSLPKTDSCSPFVIRPQNLSSGSAKVFNWNFGTSGTSSVENPLVPVYINNASVDVDTQQVELIVYGTTNACADTHSIPVYIYPELNLDFDIDNSVGCDPLITDFVNASSPYIGTNFEWYIDEDFYSSDPIPSTLTLTNATDKDSLHTVWLYGQTQYGCRDTLSRNAEVYAMIEAGFTLDKTGLCDYQSVSVDMTSSRGEIDGMDWEFNGVSFPYTATKFDHSFDGHSSGSPQNQTVKLTVDNAHGCSDSLERNILLYPTVKAGFDVDTFQICFPHTTVFTDTSVHANYWAWDFGDGLSSTDNSPTHDYSNFSTIRDSVFNAQLVARSNYDCYDTVTKPITIFAKPKADFYFPVTIDCPPFEVEMENNSEGSALDYTWTYADTAVFTEETSFVFTNDSTVVVEQPVQLIVTSDKLCADTLTKSIRVYPNLVADIEVAETEGCSPTNIDFSIPDNTNVEHVYWYIDGTAFSSIESPSHRFVNYGANDVEYEVSVVVQSVNNCVDSDTVTVTIYPTPTVDFKAMPIPAEYDYTQDQTVINFSNLTDLQSNWIYRWDFDDGTTDQESESAADFEHVYQAYFWGEKDNNHRVPISLTAWNSDNEACRDSITRNIIINPPTPQVNIFEDLSGCVPFTVDFSAETKYNYDSSYYWEFGYGLETANEEAPIYTYSNPGVYNVTLTVEGDGGVMSDYKLITVYPKPTVDFAFNDSVISADVDTVNFNNFSSNNNENFWYFDSRDIETGMYNSTLESPQWVYGLPEGEDIPYVVYPALVAKSTESCYDTLISEDPILIYQVGEIRFPNIFEVIPGQPEDDIYDTDQSANGGNRHLFYPKYASIDTYHLEVFNRWGITVFESYEVEQGWNGTVDGELAVQGVYVFRCKGRFKNGQAYDVRGDVTLVYCQGNE